MKRNKTRRTRYKSRRRTLRGGEGGETFEKYKRLPPDIKEEAKHMCSGMYPDVDDEMTAELVSDYFDSTENTIYILRKNREMAAFIIARNELCEDSCFDCKTLCTYILLTCVGTHARGQGVFKRFLLRLEEDLKGQNVECIRLTAVNKTVFRVYSALGFNSENSADPMCEFKMIKHIWYVAHFL